MEVFKVMGQFKGMQGCGISLLWATSLYLNFVGVTAKL